MLERSERVLRIACICLAALLTYQVASLIARKDPLANLKIPALPTLAPATNAQTAGVRTNPPSVQAAAKSGTNALADQALGMKGTNPAMAQASAGTNTNSVASQTATTPQTNAQARSGSEGKGTNSAAELASVKSDTNSAPGATPAKPATNALAQQGSTIGGTNLSPDPALGMTGTVSAARGRSGSRGTNAVSARELAMAGNNPSARGGGARRGPDLPPDVQARVDRITESELLAPVIRPQPMALLGIAGTNVFLRAPNGQTGMIKEGDELGGVKLVRIGTNRVLVEEDGQKKELMIFQGYGGESLLPKEKDILK